jgi:hypothetical protein
MKSKFRFTPSAQDGTQQAQLIIQAREIVNSWARKGTANAHFIRAILLLSSLQHGEIGYLQELFPEVLATNVLLSGPITDAHQDLDSFDAGLGLD